MFLINYKRGFVYLLFFFEECFFFPPKKCTITKKKKESDTCKNILNDGCSGDTYDRTRNVTTSVKVILFVKHFGC